MRILLVGGGGFIGSWLAKRLERYEFELFVVDPFKTYTQYAYPQQVIDFRKESLLAKTKIY